MSEPADLRQRRRALDTTGSFIVQAPAGSGKTELLIQRFLALLAEVDAPEEILAITFTRKAAAEMRDRILGALAAAASDTRPGEPHRVDTWRLARAARARAAELDWALESSPGRLRVMTIDAFHAALGRQMPMLSGAGGALRISEQPGLLYLEATRRALAHAGDADEAGQAARGLLRHLDNRHGRAMEMLVELLARRDQWMGRILEPRAMPEARRRQALERGIRSQVERVLAVLRAALPPELQDEIVALMSHAAGRLAERDPASPVLAWDGLEALPPADADHLDAWRGLAGTLLTKNGDWRKAVTVATGFPPDDKDPKARMTALLERLRGDEPLREALAETARLPPPRYEETQWMFLNHLLALLPLAVAELEVVMRTRGEADYVAVAQAARRALDTGEGPTDLALALDYRLSHILVDEFQDTSVGQVELMRLLTEGWTAGDGRTLFCVGDPMQSIYGFREAEVGLFLQVRQERRIGQVPVEPLTLEVNFRSAGGIVEWVNRAFGRIMPDLDEEDPRLGAVGYVAARAHHGPGPEPAVRLHGFELGDTGGEASRVVELVRAIGAADQGATIGILVRARKDLARIAPALRAAGLAYQAVDIQPLADRPVIQDLLSLTRAIVHQADRSAWLSVYRASWCGAGLATLAALASDPETRTPLENAMDPAVLAALPAPEAARVSHTTRALAKAVAGRGRCPLARLVEGTWLALGGPAALEEASDLEDAGAWFELLSGLEEGGDVRDPAALEGFLGELYAAPDTRADGSLQLMTIHKAKGLQFDYVLLPGLEGNPPASGRRLLHWLEFAHPSGTADLLLASIAERGQPSDPLQDYLRELEKRRSDYELGRVLYVAATRARRQLHLLGRLKPDPESGGFRPPPDRSMLGMLWDTVAEDFEADLLDRGGPSGDPGASPRPAARLRRVAGDWRPPAPPPAVVWSRAAPGPDEQPELEYQWVGPAARAVGTVVHRWLERLAAEGIAGWDEARLASRAPVIRTQLAEAGVPADEMEAAGRRVLRALVMTLADERGRWLLSDGHAEAERELPVAGVIGGRVVHGKVDRCFLDTEGTLWIVDYKTSLHEGGALDTFLEREVERHAPQLERYARLLAERHPGRRLRVGLYYPLHRAWREWRPGDGVRGSR